MVDWNSNPAQAFPMVHLDENLRTSPARALKHAAMQLFAERGVDGVTVREIAAAAGQKNHGAVGYYFGSKQELIRQLVVDGAELIDARRNEQLDSLEAAGQQITKRQIIDLLIYPSLDLAKNGTEECYNRFIVLFAMTHRADFLDTLDGRWNRGFQRCIVHLRQLMPHLSPSEQTERIVFLETYLGAVLAARESVLADSSRDHKTWSRPDMLEHFARTLEAMITTD